ncbi:MAG: urea ABC transporter permease subunit UrtB, partial [Hyphomicrobiales bacterium]|nr:urea ABC transporter permease subunit UrtB [Hyphomicrobiales bacterium]
MRRGPRILGRLLLLLALISSGACAAERPQLLAGFASENFTEIDNAVVALAASGYEMAPALLSALADRRLFYDPMDKQIFLKGENGKSFDGLTGAELSALPAGLKPVRINNRVRATIDAALGSLALMAPDPSKRREAAELVFKSRSA